MERLNGGQQKTECSCGWIGSGQDFTAVNKSVQPWETMCQVTATDGEPSTENVSNSNWLFRVAKQIALFAGSSNNKRGEDLPAPFLIPKPLENPSQH
jgi:hypothetical protein